MPELFCWHFQSTALDKPLTIERFSNISLPRDWVEVKLGR